MAAGQFTLTDKAIQDLGNTIDWVANLVTAILVDANHSPVISEDVYSDISADEITVGAFPDYSQETVTSKILLKGTVTEVGYSSSQVSFGNTVTISARYLYFVVGTASSLNPTDVVLGYCDLNEALGPTDNVSSLSSTFFINPSSVGWFRRIRG